VVVKWARFEYDLAAQQDGSEWLRIWRYEVGDWLAGCRQFGLLSERGC